MSSFSLSSNLPQFYTDCANFPPDFSEFSAPVAGAMWGDEGGFSLLDYQVPPEVDVGVAVSGLVLPERGGVSDMAVPALPEFNMGGLCGIAGVQSFGGGYQQDVCEFGDECGGFVPDFRPVYPATAGDNWGIQGNHIAGIEESNTKVGRYSVEERKDRILRYLKKRNQRNFNKTIKYACRKTLADRRVRVRGRFARNSELCEEEMAVKKNENTQEEKEQYYNDTVQMKHDEEDWLQEAIASLMYLPYFSG
ncbi:hypothetical protein PVL29_026291 [Vitis rotundifolia]|uniref:CCT domain-containing protein n=1 Tax=Vitis rotundifolia TaxID=103349 RepID=A0AA38YM60_VITRO|nr:hypothetical protein PVL29_026291 [Vitis rotundifolia]